MKTVDNFDSYRSRLSVAINDESAKYKIFMREKKLERVLKINKNYQ